MDWMTPLGYLIGLSTVGYTLVQGQSLGLIFNAHALLLVYGGTIGTTLLTYPQNVIAQAIKAIRVFLAPGARPSSSEIVTVIVKLSENVRRQGIESIQPDLNQMPYQFLAS